MKSHSEKARELFLEGFNCSQAVVGAFCDDMDIDMNTAMKMASPLGGGMGRMREVCGAVSGMFIVLGYFFGYDDPKDFNTKKELYSRVQELADTFRKENGSIICRELLSGVSSSPTPEKRTEAFYKKRPCAELVAYAAQILEEYIEEHR